MTDKLLIAVFVGLTIFCWGAYGPVLHNGQQAMKESRLRPLLCVGIAYFAIAVVVPIILLTMNGEKGEWSAGGITWSLFGGALGAIGALGIILAVSAGGKPVYVMPLVFGFAPIVNAIITVGINGAYKRIPPTYLGGIMAGIIMVAIGGFLVLFCATRGKTQISPPAATRTADRPATSHG